MEHGGSSELRMTPANESRDENENEPRSAAPKGRKLRTSRTYKNASSVLEDKIMENRLYIFEF